MTQEYVALDEQYIWIKAAQEVYNESAGGHELISEAAVSNCTEGTHFPAAINADEMSTHLHKCIDTEQL